MRSPINWALLGLLIRRSSYGYELLQRFERAYPGTIELSSRSQVYTALDSLTRRGLIEQAPAEQSASDAARQQKVRYRPTVAGVRAYEQWLIEQVSENGQQSRVLAQHVAALEPEYALGVLERCADACLDATGEERPSKGQGGEQLEGLAERLAGEDRRLRAAAVLNWIEYARCELRAAARRGQR
jgi:DNA-binding PadR family transcriptional regulator